MERINLTDEKKRPHFIGSWNIKNYELCNEIINFFEENKILQKNGEIGSGKDFTKKNTSSTDINRVSYNKIKGDYSGDRFIKYGYQRGRSTLNNRAVETMSLNSDWFRNDKEAAWLEQLFISPEVYILKGYDATDTAPADFGEYMIPVIITNKSYDKYTEANDKVAQYNLDIEYAINKRIQRG